MRISHRERKKEKKQSNNTEILIVLIELFYLLEFLLFDRMPKRIKSILELVCF